MATEHERRNWHLEKTVSVSHLISTAAAIVALVTLGGQFNTRISLVEQSLVAQRLIDSKQDADVEEFKKELKQSVRDINTKLDHLLERK